MNKTTTFFVFMMLTVSALSGSCAAGDNKFVTQREYDKEISDTTGRKMLLTIGDNRFTATLYQNPTASAFKSFLPMTVKMIELNGNEKYVELSRDLTGSASNPKSIQAGDLMIYGASTLVLFYKSFPTSFSYKRLGKIDDVRALAAAVGPGDVAVTFALQ